MSTEFDVVVIGAGPAGYHAAIRAAQLGLKTACIDAALGKDGQPALGGTCLRVGCIPSKALLDSSRQFWNMQHLFGEHGISADNAKIDVGTMVGRKDKIVKQFTGGITALFKANKISPYYGFGQLQPGKRVSVKQHDGSVVELTGKHIVIAAGSVMKEPRIGPTVRIESHQAAGRPPPRLATTFSPSSEMRSTGRVAAMHMITTTNIGSVKFTP